MKENIKRITTAFFYLLILATVFVLNIPIVDTIFVILLSILGIYEYNRCFKSKGYKPISFIGYISCLGIFLVDANIDISIKVNIIAIAIPILLVAMFAYIVIRKLEVSVVYLAITALSIIYVPFLFSFVKLLAIMPQGRILVLIAFVSAMATDTFAYEIGSRIGKHKLSPTVSPKKSIEGSVAGIIGSMIACVVIGVITNAYFDTNFNIIVLAIMGVVLSIVGQIGDLAASSIKRFCGQKDFSNLLPGHGGILDRFDSIMFVVPIVYAFVCFLSLI